MDRNDILEQAMDLKDSIIPFCSIYDSNLRSGESRLSLPSLAGIILKT
jgi:hypothetical protein